MKNTFILGIEGTAWNLSAAIVTETEIIAEVTETYKHSRGDSSREAAQHHAKYAASVIKRLLAEAKEKGVKPSDIDGIAFSQGPGLGPCLRTVATAARMLSISLGVPLIGVNHCIAHIEIGIWRTPATDPVVLYVSGANSQVISYMGGRYRVFGETLDIGLEMPLINLLGELTCRTPEGQRLKHMQKKRKEIYPSPLCGKRHGPFLFRTFHGRQRSPKKKLLLRMSAILIRKQLLQWLLRLQSEHLLTPEKKEVLLAGGVGANTRLREMLNDMCEARGAKFYVPEKRFMGDNGTMIAYTGLLMYKSGNTLSLEDSRVNPSYRTDDVKVTWIQEGKMKRVPEISPGTSLKLGEMLDNGAEAIVTWKKDLKGRKYLLRKESRKLTGIKKLMKGSGRKKPDRSPPDV